MAIFNVYANRKPFFSIETAELTSLLKSMVFAKDVKCLDVQMGQTNEWRSWNVERQLWSKLNRRGYTVKTTDTQTGANEIMCIIAHCEAELVQCVYKQTTLAKENLVYETLAVTGEIFA